MNVLPPPPKWRFIKRSGTQRPKKRSLPGPLRGSRPGPCPLLLLAVVLAKLQEVEDVGVPRLLSQD